MIAPRDGSDRSKEISHGSRLGSRFGIPRNDHRPRSHRNALRRRGKRLPVSKPVGQSPLDDCSCLPAPRILLHPQAGMAFHFSAITLPPPQQQAPPRLGLSSETFLAFGALFSVPEFSF